MKQTLDCIDIFQLFVATLFYKRRLGSRGRDPKNLFGVTNWVYGNFNLDRNSLFETNHLKLNEMDILHLSLIYDYRLNGTVSSIYNDRIYVVLLILPIVDNC